MGFVRKRTVYKLVWDPPHELAGLEVRVTGASVGEMLDMAALADADDEVKAARSDEAFTRFAEALVSWNLETEVLDEGGVTTVPVPATLDGVRAQDLDFVLELIQAWMRAIVDVPPPLPDASTPGGSSGREVSIPMEALPGNPPL
jgi:hypothetical protein